MPLVNVWMNTPVTGLPSVFPDCEASGVMAAEHLLGRGFRHFGYLGYQRDIDSQLELNGFRGVTRRNGFRCKVCRFLRTSVAGAARGWEAFVENVEEWIDSWETPIGVFVTSDLFCRYVIDLCRLRGLHVSQDVAIVGGSNEPEICNVPAPSLTSIDQGYGQVGYRAAEMLDRLMDGKKPPLEPELVGPTELIPRQSTDACAADDPLVARALRFIAENSHERIQVKHVAAAVAATRRTIHRSRRSMGNACSVSSSMKTTT